MKLKVSTDYLEPVEINQYEWVEVLRPDGSLVRVFSDAIYVATPEQVRRKVDGKRIQ